MLEKVYVGDIGTEIRVDAEVDITSAISVVLEVTKPDSTTTTWIGSVYSTRYIKYITVSGDLSVIGDYTIIPKFTFSSWQGYGNPTILTVYPKQTTQMPDDWMNQVKKVLAFPSVDNIILTDDQIRDFCVFPALIEYFKKFPLKTTVEYSITNEATYDFPDDYTFGVADVRFVDKGYVGGSGSSFWDIVKFQQSGYQFKGFGAYGVSGYNPNALWQQGLQTRQVLASLQNQLETNKVRISYEDRKLYAYTSTTAKLNISWAKYSINFDDVRFVYKLDVVKLCQAYLLEQLADTTGIITDSTAELSINASDLRQRATDIRTEIKDKWEQIPEVILIRH